jgi:hypothetical protein
MGILHASGALAQGGQPPSLRRDLVIDGEFGFVSSLAADREGRMYVADTQLQQVHVFDARGGRLAPLGRRGPGPGEFQGILSVVAGRGDSVFTVDVAQQRITTWVPGTERRVAYTVRVPSEGRFRASSQLLVPSRGPFFLQFVTPYGAEGSDAGTRTVVLRGISREGRLEARPLLSSPDLEALVTRVGSQTSIGQLPYARAPFFALAPGDRLVHGWSATPRISLYDLAGRPISAVSVGTTPRSLPAGAAQRLLASYPADSPDRMAMEQAVRTGRLPRTAPIYKDLLVDDQGRVWVNVLTEDDIVTRGELGLVYVNTRRLDEGGIAQTPWWIFEPSGRRVAVVMGPNNVRLWQVRGGRAYGIETDSDGVQRVVRFAVP